MAVKTLFIKIDAQIYYSIALGFSILTFVLAALIAIWHINKLCTQQMNHNKKPSVLFSIPFSIYSIICIIMWSVSIVDPFDSVYFCDFQRIISVNLYTLFKLSQSVMLMLRLYEVYVNSALGYDKKTLTLWCSVLILWGIFILIIQPITSTVELDTDHVPSCTIFVHNVFILSVLGFDICSGVGNCYLFIKPIYRLKYIRRQSNLEGNSKLRKLAIKQMVLCIVTVATSVIAVIAIGIINIPQMFAGCDIVISTMCILLMYSWNNSLYEKLFCCCVASEAPAITRLDSNPKDSSTAAV